MSFRIVSYRIGAPGILALLLSAFFAVPPVGLTRNVIPTAALGGLLINEYLADPPTGPAGDANGDGVTSSANDEFIELVNSGPAPLNLSGYAVVTGVTTRFTFPAGKVIPAGEAAVIFGGGTPTGSFGNAKALGLVFTASLSLLNGGTTIAIRDNLGVTVDTLAYGSAEGNADQAVTRSPDVTGAFTPHLSASGSGGRRYSPGSRLDGTTFTPRVPLIDSISPEGTVVGSGTVGITVSGIAFDPSAEVRVDGSPVATVFVGATELRAEIPSGVTGVPGSHSVTVQNPGPVTSNAVTFIVLPAIGINEVLADPPGSAAADLVGDANGDGVRDSADDEFIEVVNRTAAAIDVGGYSITDAGSTSPRFVFPPGTVIPAGEAAVVFGDGKPTGDFGNAAINRLVFTAGSLSLNNTSETLTLRDAADNVVEIVSYGAAGGQDESLNRNPDIAGISFARHTTINGAAGRRFSPGTQVSGSSFTIGPRLDSIDPDRVAQRSEAFELIVRGTGFESGATVFADSSPIETVAGNDNLLVGKVPRSVTAIAGSRNITVRNPGGNRSNAKVLSIVPPPPSVFLVVPGVIELGSPSFTLYVQGDNFDASSTVLVEGAAVPTSLLIPNRLSAMVPAAVSQALGQKRVRVRNGDGQQSFDAFFEVKLPFVRISSISPEMISAGSGAITLSVTGAHYTNSSVVLLDGLRLITEFVSAGSLRAHVSPEALAVPGLRAISVESEDGSLSNQMVLVVLADPPLITAIDPASVTQGAVDLKVTITGAKFQPGCSVRHVESSRPGALLTSIRISQSVVEVRLPGELLRSPGTVVLRIENPDFGVSGDATLKVLIADPLVINEYLADPPEGAAGDANGDGTRSSSADEFIELLNRSADPIELSGYRLLDADQVRHVFAAGTTIPPHEAAVVFGGGAPQGGFGNAADNKLVFKATSGGLSLNNGGDTITLQDPSGRILQKIVITPAEGGAGQAINRDPDGDGASFALHSTLGEDSSGLFSPGARANGKAFTTKPFITGLEPSTVRAGSGGFVIGVIGTDLLSGAEVLFGQASLSTVFRTTQRLDVDVPAALVAEPGAVELRVRNPKGELSSSARFVVTGDAPRIARLTPRTSGTGAESLEIEIEGEHFQRRAIVTVNGEAAQTRFVSTSLLVGTLAGKFFSKSATLEIKVVNEDGNSSNGEALTVENGPLITHLSRNRVKPGRSPVELTIEGVAFKEGVLLFVNEAAVPTRFVDETEIAATIPAELVAAPGLLVLQARHPNGARSNRVNLRVKQ